MLKWRRLDVVRSGEKPECAVIAGWIYKHVTTPTGAASYRMGASKRGAENGNSDVKKSIGTDIKAGSGKDLRMRMPRRGDAGALPFPAEDSQLLSPGGLKSRCGKL